MGVVPGMSVEKPLALDQDFSALRPPWYPLWVELTLVSRKHTAREEPAASGLTQRPHDKGLCVQHHGR